MILSKIENVKPEQMLSSEPKPTVGTSAPAIGNTNVIGSCSEVATKKIKELRIYVDEECGNKAKYEIEYTLNNKLTKKKLCKRHNKSVTAWLDRINVSYNYL